ncbi:DUF3073 family protein [Nonomuraea sp. B19D2]|uniref:DUF3073 family protein n=1 Tax=Nonomuraea sp. B19D2 TaxID=3159561 RepID=UPI0032DA69A0
MGRGRAKAKQTKVARELKYANHRLDLERLRTELVSDGEMDSDEQPQHVSNHEQG